MVTKARVQSEEATSQRSVGRRVKYRDKSNFPNPFTVVRDVLFYKRREGTPKTLIIFDGDVFEEKIAPLLKENYDGILTNGEGNQVRDT